MTATPASPSDLQHGGSRTRRSDIDGLRAIAVLGVMVYHLGIPIVPGGYAGVDVFFVISGYLIAGILAAELESGHFSLLAFYERRIRRILPAVTVMCLIVSAIGFVLLLPGDYEVFAKSLISVATFSSNFYFMRKTGYFGGNAEEFPLLHTWSLAIEEQYYLVFPVLLAVLWRFGRGRMRLVFGVLAVASFVYCVQMVETRPARAFFSTPARVWELLAGALMSLGGIPVLSNRRLREAAAACGLAMIAASFVVFHSETPFPGLAALLPVAGTCLLLHAGASGPTATATLLALRPLVATGLASYSIYLWHWPLIVLAKYRYPLELAADAPGSSAALIGIGAASLAAGFLSWRYVEQPFIGMRPPADPRRTIEIALVPTLTVSLLGLAILLGAGWWWRWPETITAHRDWPLKGIGVLTTDCEPMPEDSNWPKHACRIGSKTVPPRTLLWGDSHARGLARALNPSLQASGQSLLVAISPGCPPLIGVRVFGRSRTKANCDDRTYAVFDQLRQQDIKTVVLFARWAYYAEGTRTGIEAGETLPLSRKGIEGNAKVVANGFNRTIAALLGLGIDVVVIGPVPEHPVPIAPFMLRRLGWNGPPIPELPLADFTERQKNVLPVLARIAKGPRIEVLYPHLQLCSAASCRYQDGGEPLYVDHDHLSDLGFKAAQPIVDRILAVIGRTSQEGVGGEVSRPLP